MGRSVVKHRQLLLDFSRQDMKRRYVGTLLGPLWAIVHPLATIAIFWFVFELGFKVKTPSQIPFVYYFIIGIVPWFLFMETVSVSINAILDNRHLITKIVFPSEILPVANFVVSSIPHVVMMAVVAVMLLLQDLMQFQTVIGIVYYYFCLMVLALGLSWGVSSVRVFFQDAGQFVLVVLGLLFWMTPIVWSLDILPVEYHWIILWNPMTYIVTGYREALLYGQLPWENLEAAARFWFIALLIAFGGAGLFQRLRHEFADVL